MSYSGIIYVDAEGKYLICNEYHTHTGHKSIISWTEDINEATVFYGLIPSKVRHMENIAPLKVMEHRTVRLV